jgi:hypothetical protein
VAAGSGRWRVLLASMLGTAAAAAGIGKMSWSRRATKIIAAAA